MDKTNISFFDLIPVLGGPGAMMAVFAWLMLKGLIVTAREMKDRSALKDQMIADRDQIIDLLRIEKDMWRDHAIDNMRLLEKSTQTVETAVRKLPAADGDKSDGKGGPPC